MYLKDHLRWLELRELGAELGLEFATLTMRFGIGKVDCICVPPDQGAES